MLEKHLFEYAVIRGVPRVEREEFINVGVVVYCKKHKYLHARINLNPDKLLAFCTKIDIDELRENLLAFERICAGEKKWWAYCTATYCRPFSLVNCNKKYGSANIQSTSRA